MAKNKKKLEKPKTFKMSREELSNLAGRDAMAGQWRYLTRLVERDMDMYVEDVVKKRLGISKDELVNYDLEQATVTVISKPVIKTEEKKEENGKQTRFTTK